MSAPAWMPLYVADYLADTGHLSTVEHGAYMLLIMHYWQNGGLPVRGNESSTIVASDDARLARICRMSVEDWQEIRDTIAALFHDGWRHKRVEEEIANTAETIEKRSAAGRAAGLASAVARRRNAQQSSNERATDVERPSTPSPPPTPREETTALRAVSKKATRLTADWQPSTDDLDYARSQGMPQGVIDREAENYRDYWVAKAGKDGAKLDWPATWRTWVRRTCQRAGYRPPALQANGHHGPSPPKDEHDAETRLFVGRDNRKWPTPKWGPMPNQPGCLIPPHLVKPDDGKGWQEWGEA